MVNAFATKDLKGRYFKINSNILRFVKSKNVLLTAMDMDNAFKMNAFVISPLLDHLAKTNYAKLNV